MVSGGDSALILVPETLSCRLVEFSEFLEIAVDLVEHTLAFTLIRDDNEGDENAENSEEEDSGDEASALDDPAVTFETEDNSVEDEEADVGDVVLHEDVAAELVGAFDELGSGHRHVELAHLYGAEHNIHAAKHEIGDDGGDGVGRHDAVDLFVVAEEEDHGGADKEGGEEADGVLRLQLRE